MFLYIILLTFLGSAGLIEGAAVDLSTGSLGSPLEKRASSPCLAAKAIQTASDLTGQESGTNGIASGQAKSATDRANFINFCEGKTLTNGQQISNGSCNGIPMGKIPASANMISAMITNPQPGDTIASNTDFNISVQTSHLTAGSFTNPKTTYYAAPQDLDQNGDVIGHCHVTVQEIGSLKSPTPPDPSKFAFFKGIDNGGNGQGLLSAAVTGGLPTGVYRVCTLMSSSNHQPVLMPIAQRGAQDDCTKFEVVSSGSSPSNSSSSSSSSSNSGSSNSSTGTVAIKSGSLGGAAPAVTKTGNSQRPFTVNGNTFVNEAAAVQRSCDIQFNTCANAFNTGKLKGSTLSDCQEQKNNCQAA